MVVAKPGDGTHITDVSEDIAGTATFSDAMVCKLAALRQDIELHCGTLQDIEWVLDTTERLVVLQARPVTVLPREQIFDNSNIVENYPGLSLHRCSILRIESVHEIVFLQTLQKRQ